MPVGRPFFLTLGTSAARRTSSTPAGSTAGERGDECRQEDPLLLARPCRVDHFPLDECHQEDPISFLARPCRVDRSLYPDECRQEDPIFFLARPCRVDRPPLLTGFRLSVNPSRVTFSYLI